MPLVTLAVMPIQLDHMIVPVAELDETVDFFTEILGCTYEGVNEPFSVIRVTPELTLQLAPWGTEGGMHLAFALPRAEFDAAFSRIKAAGIPFGDSFHTVGNMQGPGDEDGARGSGKAVYVFDPNRHLVEIRHYA
jgi:catechol 2,3-dioxygenase-like lactoylglutathione lyase family enzyme